MRLLHIADVPVTARDHVFFYSRTRALVFAGSIVAGCVALLWFGWRERFWLPPVIAGLFLLGLLLFRETITARFKPTNWLVRAGDEGLLVKFRSYLNYHFPDDVPSVISIPYRELKSARLVRQRRDLPDQGDGGITEYRRRVVELELDVDTADVAKALKDELGRKGPTIYRWWGSGSSRYGHYPVRLASPTTLEIEWNVVPRFRVLFAFLAPHVRILATASVREDYTKLEERGRKDQETRLIELVEMGETMAAVKIARKIYGYDLTEAKQFVDGLRGNKSA